VKYRIGTVYGVWMYGRQGKGRWISTTRKACMDLIFHDLDWHLEEFRAAGFLPVRMTPA